MRHRSAHELPGRINISTRRFWALPTSLVLSAIGSTSPRISTAIR